MPLNINAGVIMPAKAGVLRLPAGRRAVTGKGTFKPELMALPQAAKLNGRPVVLSVSPGGAESAASALASTMMLAGDAGY